MVSGHRVSDYLRRCQAKADVPEGIRPIIDRALGLNAKDCFESAGTFASELEAVISGEPAGLPDSIFVPALPESEGGAHRARDAQAGPEASLAFEILGHYQIIERIGHGGMGDVYKGYEKALDRFVAIKVLPAELARQEDFVKRFHTEATTIAKLDHPNIVRIYYTGQDRGHHFFAMQYMDGETLADPSNVLLDRHIRRALVTDFGVVKAAQAGTQITVTGVIMGTADYIAPEQARGQDIDHRADLYSMGVLMYQMLSGHLPFTADSVTSMMFQHAYEPPPPLKEIAPDVPDALAKVVMKLMAKKPEDRHQSAEDVLADLHSIRFLPAEAVGRPQTNIVKAPESDITAEIPAGLLTFAPTGRFRRLRNRIADFFGAHAPHVVQQMRTTCQQVDGAIAEYERRREQLSKLAEEARSLACNLGHQARTHAGIAQRSAQRAEAATNTIAKQKALKEQHDNEQAAAELAQLAAEQEEQAEGIGLRLAKLDATLAQLRSQRNALNARLSIAEAHLKMRGSRPAVWRHSRKLVYGAAALVPICLVTVAIYLFWPGQQPSLPWPPTIPALTDAVPGRLQAWGANRFGQCNVPAGDDFVAVAAGHFHVLALKADGTLLAWGSNTQRQCNVPIDNRFVAIAAGFSHSLGLRP
jgi:hypothetical protein